MSFYEILLYPCQSTNAATHILSSRNMFHKITKKPTQISVSNLFTILLFILGYTQDFARRFHATYVSLSNCLSLRFGLPYPGACYWGASKSSYPEHSFA